MLKAINKWVRRLFAWPLVLIGAVLVQAGGGLIIAGSWALDYDVAELLSQARGK